MADRDDPAYARAPEPDDVVRICRALNAAGARYVLIGGFAVIAHGAARFTKDIDLLVDDDAENITRVREGLAVLADNAAADIRDTDVRDHVVVRVADEIIVDLMGRACGLAYRDVVTHPSRRAARVWRASAAEKWTSSSVRESRNSNDARWIPSKPLRP